MVHEHDPSVHAPFTGWPAPMVPVGLHDPEAHPAPSNFPYVPPASVSLYPGLFPPPPGSVQPSARRSGRGKHGRRRRRSRPRISLIALVVIGVLASVGTVVALHPGPHHDAAAGDATVDSVAPGGSSDAGSPSSPAPSMDDSIGTPAHLPPVPTGTAFLKMGGDQGVAITPHEATTVFMGLWTMREDGLQASSLTELRQVEDGAALASGTSVLTCRCRSFGTVKPQEVSVIVPRTAKYPAYFFGEMAADGGGGVGLMYVMVMTRATAGSSWHIALVSGFALDESLVGHLDASGWAGDAGEPAGADGHGFTELAGLWQLAKVTGKSGDAGTFDSSSWLVSDELDYLAKYPQGKPQANGLRGKVTFANDTTVPVYGVEASDEDIVCGAIREMDTYTPAPGYAISQDAERHAFGAALEPGLYRSVTETREWQICIFGLVDSAPVPIAWDPTYHAAVSGVPVSTGRHVLPDPAQHPDMPSDGGSGGSASSGGSDGSST